MRAALALLMCLLPATGLASSKISPADAAWQAVMRAQEAGERTSQRATLEAYLSAHGQRDPVKWRAVVAHYRLGTLSTGHEASRRYDKAVRLFAARELPSSSPAAWSAAAADCALIDAERETFEAVLFHGGTESPRPTGGASRVPPPSAARSAGLGGLSIRAFGAIEALPHTRTARTIARDLAKLLERALELEGRYQKLAERKVPEWTVCAALRVGGLYLHLANLIAEAPPPASLPHRAFEAYLETIAGHVKELSESGMRSVRAAVQLAAKHRVDNECARLARALSRAE